ncbi:MAG: 2-oxoglutarate ferredoxin oxidoreductase subunit alpha, partial [Phycisphaerales bacterium]|nr:2-oxoglutarate ferredoxin oxidoreductase subunit alpha [Phycisphaerales bacterium]
AVIYELPLVVVNVQRAGPSTGMPTKTEQGDLFQALFGRSGECPCIVIAPSGPADCFNAAIEAARLAIRHMCPVIILSDGYIANGAEPWNIPDLASIPQIEVRFSEAPENGEAFLGYSRDPETLARPWALPGTPGLEHRIGSLEKQDQTGNVSYDPMNHELMVKTRAEKVERATVSIPSTPIRGAEKGDVLLLGWGSTYGAIATATDKLRAMGHDVSSAHIRHLSPLPSDLGDVLRRYERVIIPENNMGQLLMLVRARYLVDAKGINHVRGRAFRVDELVESVLELING